jgi:tRNA threonylcarbamoyladenosine biosynthesis protein TsaE
MAMAIVSICVYAHLGLSVCFGSIPDRSIIRLLMTSPDKFITKTPQETIQKASGFAKSLKAGDIVLLEGDLGAGKTTFVKGLAEGLKAQAKSVVSPTFVLMNIYKGRLPIYHFDLYRLEKPEEIASLNIDEYLQADGVAVIEWPKRLGKDMPQNTYWIEFKHKDENTREICISSPLKPQQKSSR